MTDDTNSAQGPSRDEADSEGEANTEAAPQADQDKRGVKETIRGALGDVAGFAVEIGSILGGEGGEMVQAERKVAKADTEELIDRIDGEG